MDWPVSLPYPLAASYSFKKRPVAKRMKMEVGADRARRVARQGPATFNCAWRLTDSQFETFRGFWTDIKGVDFFNIDLWVSATPATLSARFVGEYTFTRLGGNKYLVSATLESFNPPLISAATLLTRIGP